MALSVDDEPKPPVAEEERQTVASRILVEPTLATSRDVSAPQESRNDRRLEAEPRRHDRCVDNHVFVLKMGRGGARRPTPIRVAAGSGRLPGYHMPLRHVGTEVAG